MPIVIKKRVNFDFLGEEYKDAYLVFKSIPLKDYGEFTTKLKTVEKDDLKAANFILETLKKYFIEGKFPDSDTVAADDLDDLDPISVNKCFSIFTGSEINAEDGKEAPQVADLKDESTTLSSTEATGPSS